jgi:hypothetical protein
MSHAAPEIDPSLRRTVSVAVVPVSAFKRNSATSPFDGTASDKYRPDTSSAPSARFQILIGETPPRKKLLRSRVPRRTGDVLESRIDFQLNIVVRRWQKMDRALVEGLAAIRVAPPK